MKLLYGCDEALCEWASHGLFYSSGGFKDAKAIGVVDDEELLAAVIYSNFITDYCERPLTIEMSIYSVDKRWAKRHTLEALFRYPFIQLGLERVQTLCSAQDDGVISFNQRLGFQQEGIHRRAWHMGGDAISWSMLKHECRWIHRGEKVT